MENEEPRIINPALKPLDSDRVTAATMVKAYLRYEPAASFGVIASVDSNISYDSSGKHLLSPALEKIGVWHVRQGLCTKTLTPSSSSRGPSPSVTSIASSPSSLVIFAITIESRLCKREFAISLNGFYGCVADCWWLR